MGLTCSVCGWCDKEHADMYDEPFCYKGDMVIRLKQGQGRPDNCPLRKNKMTKPNEIEELLKPYGLSLKERPYPSEKGYAYEQSDRKRAVNMAINWQEQNHNNDYGYDGARDDFICHQSDVIELLINALKWANHKLGVLTCDEKEKD